jgi:hypothetical protein
VTRTTSRTFPSAGRPAPFRFPPRFFSILKKVTRFQTSSIPDFCHA